MAETKPNMKICIPPSDEELYCESNGQIKMGVH